MIDYSAGITDIEIHFLQIKFTAIGVYLDPAIVTHLQKWKGKKGSELAGDDEFFDAVISGKNQIDLMSFWKWEICIDFGMKLNSNRIWYEFAAPVEKLLRIVVIKEIKGSQYGAQLESAVRDRLAEEDKYEDEEEEALEKILEFLQSKYFSKDSILTYYFPANSSTAEVIFLFILMIWSSASLEWDVIFNLV